MSNPPTTSRPKRRRGPKARREAEPKPPPPPVRMHRSPVDITPANREQLFGMLAIGVPEEDACHAIGLSPARFKAWMSDPAEDDPDVLTFREQALRAEGQGVAQQVKILWDGGRTVEVTKVDGTGKNARTKTEKVVKVDKVVSENHKFLLSRRRRAEFGGDTYQAKRPAGPSGAPEPVEPDEIEQIIGVLAAEGVQVPPKVLAALGGSKIPT